MFKFIDKKIEALMMRRLHKRRKKIVKHTLEAFQLKHNPPQAVLDELAKRIETEADRIYPMIDKSILKAGIKRARYAFWITTISSIIIVGVLGAFSAGTALPFVIPVSMAVVAWLVALGTTPVLYNMRVDGAMNSVVTTFEEFLEKNPGLEISQLLNQSDGMNEIKSLLEGVNDKIDNLSLQIAALRSELAIARLAPKNAMSIETIEEKTIEVLDKAKNEIPDTSKIMALVSLWHQANPQDKTNVCKSKDEVEMSTDLSCNRI